MSEHALEERWTQLEEELRSVREMPAVEEGEEGEEEETAPTPSDRGREAIDAEMDEWRDVHLLTPESAKPHGREDL